MVRGTGRSDQSGGEIKSDQAHGPSSHNPRISEQKPQILEDDAVMPVSPGRMPFPDRKHLSLSGICDREQPSVPPLLHQLQVLTDTCLHSQTHPQQTWPCGFVRPTGREHDAAIVCWGVRHGLSGWDTDAGTCHHVPRRRQPPGTARREEEAWVPNSTAARSALDCVQLHRHTGHGIRLSGSHCWDLHHSSGAFALGNTPPSVGSHWRTCSSKTGQEDNARHVSQGSPGGGQSCPGRQCRAMHPENVEEGWGRISPGGRRHR